jgi:hypothetical protein
MSFLVRHVPSERLEERIDELLPDLSLVISRAAVRLDIPFKVLDQL